MRPTPTQARQKWSNWSGSVQCSPREIVKPESLDEISKLIGNYGRQGRRVRLVGAGHSFTPLVQTDDVLMSLDNFQGIEHVDVENSTVKVCGGTKLRLLGQLLFDKGLAQENLGDIDVQSIAGAISTGTHGTGIRFGTLSTQVLGLTLVTASGEVLECSAEQHPTLFKAAQLSLGTLGVIAAVTLRVVPAKRLCFKSYRTRLADCLTNLERFKAENSHFEFYWMPHTEWIQAKLLNETEAPLSRGSIWGSFNKIVLENAAYWLLSECCRWLPRLSPTISKISAQGIVPIQEVDYSHRLFATPRLVRFHEMEYSIAAEHFSTVLTEIKECIARHRIEVHFPIECRFVQADDIWLSPAYQRDSAYIAVHMYRGMPYKAYFEQIEEIFRRYQGRPHWGKMHTQNAASLAQLYSCWHNFRQVRAQRDPQGIFLNDYLRTLLDADTPVPPEGLRLIQQD